MIDDDEDYVHCWWPLTTTCLRIGWVFRWLLIFINGYREEGGLDGDCRQVVSLISSDFIGVEIYYILGSVQDQSKDL